MKAKTSKTLLSLILTLALLLVTLAAFGLQTAQAAFSTPPMISAGSLYSMALLSDGTLWGWGYNGSGQLGDGTNTTSPFPARTIIPVGMTFSYVAGGWLHTAALASDGTVWTWGWNNEGELGDGTNTNSNIPAQVNIPGGVTVTAISAGLASHTVALASDGTAWAWGYNSRGQLGDGTDANSNIPVQVNLPGGIIFTAFATGLYHTLALTDDGALWAWGFNSYGQLGDGTDTDSYIPLQVNLPAGVTVTAIAAGMNYSLALADDGTVWAWGENYYGELGDGTTDHSGIPVQVQIPAGEIITSIAAGTYHALALSDSGILWAWGNNEYGQLGNGATAHSYVPVQIDLPPGVNLAAVTAGRSHTVALADDGTVLAWGRNDDYGQLGDGTGTNSSVPVQVAGENGIGFLNLGFYVTPPVDPPGKPSTLQKIFDFILALIRMILNFFSIIIGI